MWEASWRNYELKKERDAAIARSTTADPRWTRTRSSLTVERGPKAVPA